MPRTSQTFEQIQVSKVSEVQSGVQDAAELQSVLETCDGIIRLRIPNLLRLYLNPFVAQACAAINEIVHTGWPATELNGNYPSFLANSGEEALSGAIKLARYTLNQRTEGTSPKSLRVLLVDDENRFENFASATVQSERDDNKQIEFIPDVVQMSGTAIASGAFRDAGEQLPLASEVQLSSCGIIVIGPHSTAATSTEFVTALRQFQANGCIVIAWAACSSTVGEVSTGLSPDIVVFDESFTNRVLPFGAFAARADIYSQWTRKGMATFHSTTYQPNTISTMHFLKSLKERSPEFFESIQPKLKPLLVDQQILKKRFRDLYNPALGRLISGAGFDTDEVTASGHYVKVGEKKYFDGIGGVACSLRGHNPVTWVSEMIALDSVPDCVAEVSHRLHDLTGLRHHVPAVSGGSAVEHALKLALIAQHPKSWVVALKGGFGGKTLLALTGTAKDSYKKGLDPLYPDILYVDPFADDAAVQLADLLKKYPVAVIQMELIQGVGGVRAIPETLLQSIQRLRVETGVLLFIDEIQTGMFRTGPFVRSAALGIVPDLLTIGKGTSDMMFPFALTLYSDRMDELLRRQNCTLPRQLQKRYHFEVGYRAVLNTLRRSETAGLSRHVALAGLEFERTLERDIAGIRRVRDVRVFGLLIGIELDLHGTLTQRLGLNAAQLFLVQMMNHSTFPLLMGYCQYEPGILKFTPPLTVTSDEITAVCRTITESLRVSQFSLLIAGIRALYRSGK